MTKKGHQLFRKTDSAPPHGNTWLRLWYQRWNVVHPRTETPGYAYDINAEMLRYCVVKWIL